MLIKNIPFPKVRALAEMYDDVSTGDVIGFPWLRTPQGYEFWRHVNNSNWGAAMALHPKLFKDEEQEEQDPHGKSNGEPGAKMDLGKAPIMQGVIQYFPRALQAVALLSAAGAEKYSWKGWEEVPGGINRYSNAMGRHLTGEQIEGPIDSDTGQLHKTAAAWNALAALELYLKGEIAKREK